MSLRWNLLSRHAMKGRSEERHGASKETGIDPALHAWLARSLRLLVPIADIAC